MDALALATDVTIEPQSEKPIASQLVAQLAALIDAGTLEELPPPAEFGRELRISTRAVTKAYQALIETGAVFNTPNGFKTRNMLR
ncbi:MAG: hypothetical protein AAGE01_02955 [Pseudomonadota bacterium]